MRKILCFTIIAILATSGTVFAKSWGTGNFLMGDDKACFVDTYGKNAFWFCGNQRSWCKSRDANSTHYQKTLFADEVLTLSILQAGESDITSDSELGDKYICCKGNASTKGEFVANKNVEIEKNLGEGKGSCKQIYNACYDANADDNSSHLLTDCNTPSGDSCPDGKKLRNSECVQNDVSTQCGDESAYESAASNKCIPCVKETYRGISSSEVCITCDKTTEFYSDTRKECRNIEDAPNKYSAEIMKQCWKCSSADTIFKNCMDAYKNGYPATGQTYKGTAAVNEYIKDNNCVKDQ